MQGIPAGQALRLRVQAEQHEHDGTVRPLPRPGCPGREAWQVAIGLILKIFLAL